MIHDLNRDELVEVQRALRAARKDRSKQNAGIRDYPDQDPVIPAEMRATGARRLAAIESALARVDSALTRDYNPYEPGTAEYVRLRREIGEALDEALAEHAREPRTSVWLSFWDRLHPGEPAPERHAR